MRRRKLETRKDKERKKEKKIKIKEREKSIRFVGRERTKGRS